SATPATLRFEAGDVVVFQGTGRAVTAGAGPNTVQVQADMENDLADGGGTVTQDTAATVSVTADVLQLTAPAGIGSPALRSRFDAGQLGTSSSADQFLQEENDVILTTLTAGAANIDLISPTGNVFDDGVNATLITADRLTLRALRAIGKPDPGNEL